VLAVATTLGHFVIMLGFPVLVRRVKRQRRTATAIRISYADGRGLLRTILIRCTGLRFAIDHVQLSRSDRAAGAAERVLDALDAEDTILDAPEADRVPGVVTLSMQVTGKRPISHLIASLSDIDGVLEVGTTDDSEID
jgi:putative Mg2+ transporter-C (MgtC) family protein